VRKKNRTQERIAVWKTIIADIRHWERLLISRTDLIASLGRIPPSALAVAFKQLDLDAKKPAHRELLLAILADIVFGPPKRAGRRRGSAPWEAKLLPLALLHAELIAKEGPVSDSQAAREISANHKEYQSAETIRRHLPKARERLDDLLARETLFSGGTTAKPKPRRRGLSLGK
jgi:hypothetical protein